MQKETVKLVKFALFKPYFLKYELQELMVQQHDTISDLHDNALAVQAEQTKIKNELDEITAEFNLIHVPNPNP